MTETYPIPILRSILSPTALVERVEAAYDLKVTRMQLVKAVVLDTYRVWTNHGLYMLRVYPGQRRTRCEIDAELAFVSYLHNQGARVSIPVAQRGGENVITLHAPEGIRSGVLFTYAPGAPVGENLTAVRTYGQTLAHIHAIADRLSFPLARTPLDLAFLLDRSLAHLADLAHYRHDWACLHQVAAAIRPQLAALSTTPPTYGYCHGDAGVNNAHVDATGQVMLFDFDCCGLGWRAYDLATFVSDESTEVADAFLQGYQAMRPITPAEQAALPLFQIVQGIWMLGTRASYLNEWGEIHFTDRFIDHILASIKAIFATVGSRN